MNPLRFPGSKRAFAPILSSILSDNEFKFKTVLEPFGGGMSVSLYLIESKVVESAKVCEKDPMVFAFWSSLQKSAAPLVERVASAEINVDTFRRMKGYLTKPLHTDDEADVAFAYLFLNRTTFSGIVTGGPIGGYSQSSKYRIDCRFYKDTLIKRLQHTHSLLRSVDLTFGDGIDFIRDNQKSDAFFYVDPPYFYAGPRLYRHYYEPEEHILVKNALAGCHSTWFLSYDMAHQISSLYREYYVYEAKFQYSARAKTARTELFISNKSLSFPNEVHVGKSFRPSRDGFDILRTGIVWDA